MSIGIVQIRGEPDMDAEVQDTLEMLNLGRVNNFTIVPDEDSYKGMVVKANDYVAYGEPDESTVALLLEKRGE
ncbi:MAG: uL30 family ribosomal protein, partial [Halobacteria archaeon]|nr:uL30 family ribosomal protein [Halobacteria archaeon]